MDIAHYDYEGQLAEHYDRLYAGYDVDTAFYVDLAKESGSPVLELGCGTGRITFEVARRGIDIVGLDISKEMLAIARAKLAALPAKDAQHVNLVQGTMTDFQLDQRFRLAMIPFRAFLHLLTVEEEMQALTVIRDHLQDGGLLAMNIFDPRLDIIAEHMSPLGGALKKRSAFDLPDSDHRMFVWEARRYDPVEQMIYHDMVYEELDAQGQSVSRRYETMTLRYIYRWEMAHMLARCGYRVEALYGDFQRGPLRHGGELVWIARKA